MNRGLVEGIETLFETGRPEHGIPSGDHETPIRSK